MDLVLTRITELRPGYVELRLARPDGKMPAMVPGQFFEVRIDDTPSKFLRRPISVNNVKDDELWLLVHAVGNGTQWIANRRLGDTLNVIGPLGNGFDMDAAGNRPLLVGGGVGTAPMLYLGQQFVRAGAKPIFLLGGRSASDLLQLEHFQALGEVLRIKALPVIAEPVADAAMTDDGVLWALTDAYLYRINDGEAVNANDAPPRAKQIDARQGAKVFCASPHSCSDNSMVRTSGVSPVTIIGMPSSSSSICPHMYGWAFSVARTAFCSRSKSTLSGRA